MNERVGKELRRIGTRIAQGAVIGVFIVFTMGMVLGNLNGGGDVSYAFLLRQYVAGFVLGMVFNVMNILFEEGTLGLTQTTIIHFLVTFIVFVPLGLYAGWLDPGSVLMASVIFILIYVGIWLGSYLMWKREVERINGHLGKKS